MEPGWIILGIVVYIAMAFLVGNGYRTYHVAKGIWDTKGYNDDEATHIIVGILWLPFTLVGLLGMICKALAWVGKKPLQLESWIITEYVNPRKNV